MNKHNLYKLAFLILVLNIFFVSSFYYTYSSHNKNAKFYDLTSNVLDIELIENTDYCLTDCYSILRIIPKADINLNDYKENKITFYDKFHNDALKYVKNYKIFKLNTKSYYEDEPVFIPCIQIHDDYVFNTSCVSGYQSVLKYVNVWEEFDLFKSQLKINEPLTIKLLVNKDPKQSIDWIPTFLDQSINEWAWYSSNYTKKRQINITNTFSSSISNVSVLLNISYDSDMQPDFDDLRFLDAEEDNELGYWFYNNTYKNASNVYVWVLLNRNISAISNTTIYMYYGNSVVNTTSNVTNAGLFGEDFNNPNLDWSTRWYSTAQTRYNSTVNGQLNCTVNTGNAMLLTYNSYSNYVFETRFSTNDQVGNYGWYFDFKTLRGSWTGTEESLWYEGIDPIKFYFKGTGTAGGTVQTNNSQRFVYSLNGSNGNATLYHDDGLTQNFNRYGVPNATNTFIGFNPYGNNGTRYIDWVYIRRYTPSTPSYTISGESSLSNVYPIFYDLYSPQNGSQYNPSVNDIYIEIRVNNTNGSVYANYNGFVSDLFFLSDVNRYGFTYDSLYFIGTNPYYFYSYGNDENNNYNQSNTYYLTILKNSSYSMGLTVTKNITYGTLTNFTGYVFDDLGCTLNITNGIFNVGYVYANYSCPSNPYYSSKSVVNSTYISKAQSQVNLYFDVSSPHDYRLNFTPYCNIVIGNGTANLSLGVSGVPMNLSIGVYTFNCSYNGSNNYYPSSMTSTMELIDYDEYISVSYYDNKICVYNPKNVSGYQYINHTQDLGNTLIVYPNNTGIFTYLNYSSSNVSYNSGLTCYYFDYLLRDTYLNNELPIYFSSSSINNKILEYTLNNSLILPTLLTVSSCSNLINFSFIENNLITSYDNSTCSNNQILMNFTYQANNLPYLAIENTFELIYISDSCGSTPVYYTYLTESGCSSYSGSECSTSMFANPTEYELIMSNPLVSTPIWAQSYNCLFKRNDNGDITYILAFRVASNGGQFCTIQDRWNWNVLSETTPVEFANPTVYYCGVNNYSFSFNYLSSPVTNLSNNGALLNVDFTKPIYMIILILVFITVCLLLFFGFPIYAGIITFFTGLIMMFSGIIWIIDIVIIIGGISMLFLPDSRSYKLR